MSVVVVFWVAERPYIEQSMLKDFLGFYNVLEGCVRSIRYMVMGEVQAAWLQRSKHRHSDPIPERVELMTKLMKDSEVDVDNIVRIFIPYF